MTPRQARVALIAFVLTAAGVTYNALYVQGESDAGRLAAAVTDDPKAARTQAAHRTRAGSIKHVAALTPEPTANALREEAGADTVRAIQRELDRRGFGPLASDGIIRPVTRAAIMSYEHDHRLPLTGEATEALLERLLLGAPATNAPSRPGEVRSPHAEALIREVQRMLAANGYRPGPVDGRMGAETATAIRAFEQDQGLAPKGRVSAELVARLQAGAARLKSAELR